MDYTKPFTGYRKDKLTTISRNADVTADKIDVDDYFELVGEKYVPASIYNSCKGALVDGCDIGTLTEHITVSAGVDLDKVFQPSSHSITNQTNYEWEDAVPSGGLLTKVIIRETSGNAAGNIRIGTTDGGEQVVREIAVGASKTLIVDCDWEMDWSTAKHLFINSDGWGSGEVTVSLIIMRLV